MKDRRKTAAQMICWLLVAACLMLIFGFSGQDGDASHGVSLRVTRALLRLLGKGEMDVNGPAFLHAEYIVRKLAHACEYALLSLLMLLTLSLYSLPQWNRMLIDYAGVLTVACADEWRQSLTAGRYGMLEDVGIDMLGAVVGAAFFFAAFRLFRGRLTKN
ncbi:MAG: hypothetical protein EOM69_06565 [Clostridia bacterium]|nr:hypothetical protein [Clostridia bacterium]